MGQLGELVAAHDQPQPELTLTEQLGQAARGGDPPLVEDHHPVADPLDPQWPNPAQTIILYVFRFA